MLCCDWIASLAMVGAGLQARTAHPFVFMIASGRLSVLVRLARSLPYFPPLLQNVVLLTRPSVRTHSAA